MAEIDTPWVVQLYYSFQDPTYLHLIMEFCPGGDLMTMLLQYDTFSEDITKFYVAECVCAVEAVHNLGFVHRDVKPDNCMFIYIYIYIYFFFFFFFFFLFFSIYSKYLFNKYLK